MARINRSDVIQKAVNDLGISTSTEKIPNETLDKVQLTYNLNRNFSSFLTSGGATSSGTLTVALPTIDARSEIYITAINCNYSKDATCDQSTGTLAVKATPVDQGIAKDIATFSVTTLIAQYDSVNLAYPYPIKIKPNTSLTFASSFSVGSMTKAIQVAGFIVSSN